jgi:hypothetical protein
VACPADSSFNSQEARLAAASKASVNLGLQQKIAGKNTCFMEYTVFHGTKHEKTIKIQVVYWKKKVSMRKYVFDAKNHVVQRAFNYGEKS